MTTANPVKLPECFHWAEESDAWRLYLDDVPVLEIRPQREGWIVHVHLCDAASPQPDVAVRSIAAGMRWGARWAKLRAPQLSAMAARRRASATQLPSPPEEAHLS